MVRLIKSNLQMTPYYYMLENKEIYTRYMLIIILSLHK